MNGGRPMYAIQMEEQIRSLTSALTREKEAREAAERRLINAVVCEGHVAHRALLDSLTEWMQRAERAEAALREISVYTPDAARQYAADRARAALAGPGPTGGTST